MSARTLTYAELAAGFVAASGNNPNAGNIASWLNNAYRWAWRRPKTGPWSEAIKNTAVAVTAGKVAWNLVEYAETWRLWSEDPRPFTSAAYVIESTHDADGIWPRTDLATVWAEYLPRVPAFSGTAYGAGTVYRLDDVMLFTDGNCYRCLATTAAGENPTTTPAKWSVQPVLQILQSAVIYEALSYFRTSLGDPDQAASIHADAEEDLQDEWTKDEKNYHSQSYPPLSWH